MRLRIIPAVALALFLVGGCSNDPYPPPGDKKVLYGALGEDPHGLDPVQAGDTLSAGVIAQIYDSLYEYHYLKRPYELKPCLARAMPQVSEDRLTYTIPVKQGVYFQDDPCFERTGGKGRELVAGDFVYGIKRLADQGNDPRGWWLLQGKVVGLDEFHERSVEAARREEPMDYSMPVAGLRAVDRYRLQIELKEPYPQLKYALAMSYTSPVPREAVRFYGEEFYNHPVGTGPFRLKEWSKRWRLILERNPTYREDRYPTEGEPADREAGLLGAAGRRMPFVDEVYYSIIYESQPAWLYFKQGYQGISGITKEHFQEAITPDRGLAEKFRERGTRLMKMTEADVFYTGFNMEDPVVGDNKKLRQAMCMAFDTQWRIKTFLNGRGISAQSPIPPGIFGYNPDYRHPYKENDPAAARELLAQAGYPGGVGSDGRRLELTLDLGSSGPRILQRARAFADDMARIGIDIEIRTNTWAEFLRKLGDGRMQMFSLGWVLDYPDPENFLQLLYGPNKPRPNGTRFDRAGYNELYERMKAMPNTPERYRIIQQMVRLLGEEVPWIPSYHRISFILLHPWVKNYKPHGITGGYLKYRDVDLAERRRLRHRWNRPNYELLFSVLGALAAISVGAALLSRRRPSGGSEPT